ncbi:MAG: glycosyltransferase family 2 protein [Actinobacteria bacterium]|nr:glycosyltransferase family 2 protein [Actinomycetota bacterium]
MHHELPSFDLVVATVARVQELERFLTALEFQTQHRVRLILVDQNPDDRLVDVVEATSLDVLHLRSQPGLSRARNAGLAHVTADVVAFPDDDCAYQQDLLAHVGRILARDPGLDGVTGRSVDRGGRSATSWKRDAALLTDRNLWNRAISYTIFLRRQVVERVGMFDERLGLGSPEPWSSGEEIDYLIRAVRSGARIRYDPSLTVRHDGTDHDTAFRDGASIGYLLRKHRYSKRMLARMLVRPAGGVIVSLAHRDGARARSHAATLRGRLRGYRETSSENTTE